MSIHQSVWWVQLNINYIVSIDMKALELESMEQIEGGSGVLQCVTGTTGGAILGGLAGARTGTMILPGKGTFWGGVIGIVGGGLAGAAASCF
jgi:outer membrane lipoprotein SlyB